jgi:glycosyltransferase involved in cell wall biosynthesis
MALGKPVIAARRGMLPEVVEDGKSGLIVDDSPSNLANAILKVGRDESLRGRMGKQAYLRAREEFDLEKQAEKVETVYRGAQQ